MSSIPPRSGNYFHTHHRESTHDDIFNESENYCYFLRLYEKCIDPIASTFTWCLLINHFQLLVCIKADSEMGPKSLSYWFNDVESFKHYHSGYPDLDSIRDLLFE